MARSTAADPSMHGGRLGRFKRAAKRWLLRAWLDLEPEPLEPDDRMARALLRWGAARMSPARTPEEWTRRFAVAVRQGLEDAPELAPARRAGLLEASSLGAAAAAAMLFEADSVDRALGVAGAAGRWGDPYSPKGFDECWGGPARSERSLRRAKWLAVCGQDASRWMRSMESFDRPGIIRGLAIPFWALAAIPALLCCWGAAAWRVRRQARMGALAASKRSERAVATLDEAMRWLGGKGEKAGSKAAEADAVWQWPWAGVVAREGEKAEAAAWLAGAAAMELPPRERALAAACWFEGVCMVLGGSEAQRFQSCDDRAPWRMMASLAKGSRIDRGGLASEMISCGFQAKGVGAFLAAGRRGSTPWRGGGLCHGLHALAAVAWSVPKDLGGMAILERADAPFACGLAEALLDGRMVDDQGEQARMGQALARNPLAPEWEAICEGHAFFAAMRLGHPFAMAFRSWREARGIEQELLGAPLGGGREPRAVRPRL